MSFSDAFKSIDQLIRRQGIKALTRNGVLGDPRIGEEYLELWTEKMVDFIHEQIDI